MNEELKLQLFDLKQKFLREIPHPKLILKEMKTLQRMERGIDLSTINYDAVLLSDWEIEMNLEAYLDQNIIEILRLKQRISQTNDVIAIFECLRELYDAHVRLIKKLNRYVHHSVAAQQIDLKMSVPIDTYAILKRIRTLNLKENEIKDYLCNEINVHQNSLDPIVINCLRANKILRNV